MALGAILERIWAQVRRQVGAKLAPKSIKMQSKITSKKEVEKKMGKSLFGELRPLRGPPGEGDKGGGKNGTREGSYLSQHANGPKARRIFYKVVLSP